MKDLSKFLSENKEDTTKPHAVKDGKGVDDVEYFELMSEYKKLRRSDDDKAMKVFEKAKELATNGDVSKNVKLAVAYL